MEMAWCEPHRARSVWAQPPHGERLADAALVAREHHLGVARQAGAGAGAGNGGVHVPVPVVVLSVWQVEKSEGSRPYRNARVCEPTATRWLEREAKQ